MRIEAATIVLSMDVSPSPARDENGGFGGSCPKGPAVGQQRSGKRRATTHSQYAPCASGTTTRPSGCLTAAPAPRYSPVVLPRRARLFSTIAVLTVAAVNAAGLWSIAASRRAAADEGGRLFRLGTETRARALEARPDRVRASDLEFLAGSPLVTRILAGGARGDPEQSARRDATESALLLFLRAHPEVTRLAVRAHGGRAARASSAGAAACPSSGSRRTPPAARARPWPPDRAAGWRTVVPGGAREAEIAPCLLLDRARGRRAFRRGRRPVLRARRRARDGSWPAASPRSASQPLEAAADVGRRGLDERCLPGACAARSRRTSPPPSWSRWPRAIARPSP